MRLIKNLSYSFCETSILVDTFLLMTVYRDLLALFVKSDYSSYCLNIGHNQHSAIIIVSFNQVRFFVCWCGHRNKQSNAGLDNDLMEQVTDQVCLDINLLDYNSGTLGISKTRYPNE
jgi:hypothetical protein